MSTKLIVFAVALIAAGPVLAAGGASSAGGGSSVGSSNVSASSGGGHSSGGGGSTGGGGHMGGGGASAGLGGRGAAASARGATLAGHGTTLASHGATRIGTMHASNAVAKHAAVEHATSKLVSTERHHHPFRREPRFRTFQWDFEVCHRVFNPNPLLAWSDCDGPTKSSAGSKRHS